MVLTKASLLLSLAPELIQIITDYLDTSDVERFRLSCKTLGALLRPHVFRVLRFKVIKNTLRTDIDRLSTLARAACTPGKAPAMRAGSALQKEEVHPACYGTRTLYIGPLAPSYDGPTTVLNFVDGEWVSKSEDSEDDMLIAGLGEEILKMYLFDALASLKGVSSVEWTPTHADSVETQRTVMEALKTLPNLRSVRFSLGQCKIGLPLDTLTSLREVTLSGTCEADHDVTLAALARLVGATPALTAIDIATNWVHNRPIGRAQSLHALFAHCPRGAPPLRLRRLALKAALVRLDAVTLPHLRCLTALSLTSIEDPYMRGRYEQKRYGSGLEEVWQALRGAEIWLEELTVDVVVPALVEYLKAYSGLKKLAVTPKNLEEGTRSDAMADEFYTGVLGRHASSLQELEVEPLYEGKWCIGRHNLAAIANCRQMKFLKMCIIGDQVNSKGLKALIDEAAFSMPRLDDIQIDATEHEGHRGPICDGYSVWHFWNIRRLMSESVRSYRAPHLFHRLPARVSIAKCQRVQEFVAQGVVCDEGGELRERLRYVCITPES
ncbi:hypothetical protein BJ912DRAFT_909833 [Pholiota molesta]|nr:hypothetical protein BJ912DRAFT_909833 [Pholiota molesta]